MKIKIVKENESKIEQVLKGVNGKAIDYTLTSYSELQNIANKAIDKIYNVLQNKAICKDAVLHYTSGGAVSNRYKYSRKATYVSITFNSKSEAFLVAVCSVGIYKEGGKKYIEYTKEQTERIKELAVEKASKFQ